MKVFVDKWPDFRVVVCKPQWEQKGDSFKDIGVFANDDDAVLEAIIRKPSVFDWTTYSCVGTNLENRKIFKAVATEKHISSRDLALCYRMTLNDVSSLPSTDRYNQYLLDCYFVIITLKSDLLCSTLVQGCHSAL